LPSSENGSTCEAIHREAQNRFLAAGKKLTPEEMAKRDKNPFEMWDAMRENARAGRFPKGTDVFLYKFHGLFYVAPAQNSFMCRLRFPGGIATASQLRGVADIAEQWGGGFADVTTRANLQIREITAENGLHVVSALMDLGILARGSGADNIRNITGSPTAGIDPQELIDTRPLCREMHHYIMQHREMYGLPRKFNIAFDGGGKISAVADTNDVGFVAVRVHENEASESISPGIYFRLELGGITGHLDFARDTGVLLKPEECVAVAAAIIRVFIQHGDRTDRKKARLKYVLDQFGFEKFLQLVEQEWGHEFRRFPLDQCEPRGTEDRLAHLGVHDQKQPGLHYVGVVLPVGRVTADQLRGIAQIASGLGSGTVRLTVWQNLLISDIPSSQVAAVKQRLQQLGLDWAPTNIRAGLIACTGNGGCRFAASNTKQHALQIAEYLESRLSLDQPLNIHLTGCHHSCAQHYIGDIGLLATKVSVGEELVEGYHLFVGGGYGAEQGIGRELFRDLVFGRVPETINRLLQNYLDGRLTSDETFREYVRRLPTEELLNRFRACSTETMPAN
jgi:ferredoxin-nitrite reductase